MKIDEEIIYFDESGNTEKGIRDAKQLFITFASIASTEKICKDVLEKAFNSLESNEIKYNEVGRDKEKIIKCLSEFKERGGRVKTYSVYKPLFLFHSLLTSFFEDSAKHIGADNLSGEPDFTFWRLHNYWFHYIVVHGEKFLADLIFAYQDIVFDPNKETYQKIFDLSKEKADTGCPITKMIFASLERQKLEGVCKLLYPKNDISIDRSLWIDSVFSITCNLFSRWYSELKEPLNIIHDESYTLEKRKKLIKFLNSLEHISPIQSKINPELQFFLNSFEIKKLEFKESKSYYGLQVADLFAGFVNEVFKNAEENASQEIKNLFDTLTTIVEPHNCIHMVPDLTIITPKLLFSYQLKKTDPFCKEAIINCIQDRL